MVNSKRGSWGGAEDCHWFKVTPCTPRPDIYCNFLLNWPLSYHQWGTVRGRNRSSDFLLSINQVYFECQGNKSISTFAKAYTGTWFLPGWMQSHCLPGLCQQYLCACVWQPQQHVMPKQLWPLHRNIKGQYISTENNCQSLTAITHKRSWALVYTDLIGILH